MVELEHFQEGDFLTVVLEKEGNVADGFGHYKNDIHVHAIGDVELGSLYEVRVVEQREYYLLTEIVRELPDRTNRVVKRSKDADSKNDLLRGLR